MFSRWIVFWGVAMVGPVFGGLAHATVTADPATVDIGDVAFGSASIGQTLIRASGMQLGVPGNITPAQGQLCPEFTVTAPATAFLLTQSPIPVSVSFTPQSLGFKRCEFSVNSGAGDPLGSFEVIGTGIGPEIVVSATAIDFGSVTVGETSAPMQIVVVNSGTAPLHVSSTSLPAGFTASANPDSPIPARGHFTWNITCTPMNSGTLTGTFEVTSDTVDGAPTAVQLTCTGDQGSPHDENPMHGGCATGRATGGAGIAIALLVLRRRRSAPRR